MVRRLAGVVGAGARDPAVRARLEAAVPGGAWWEAEGVLLRHTGPAPERRGERSWLVDGTVYAGDPAAEDVGPLRGECVLLRWDHARGRGVLAADQLGGRTLCWALSGADVVFGSEAREVLAALPRRPGPDEVSVARWLAGGGPPAGRTLYAGVHRLGGGQQLELGGGAPRERSWWQPRYAGVGTVGVPEVREALREAVTRRMDPTAGVLLSGGIDSATVAGFAALAGPGLRTVSAVFPDEPSVDESALVALLADRLGARSETYEGRAGAALAGTLPYLEAWALPPSSPNLFFWLPMLRGAAAGGVGALLDGEGGDELFGAPRYLLADALLRGRPDRALRLARRFPGAGPRPPWRPVRQVLIDYGLRGAVPRLRRPVRAPAWMREQPARLYEASDPAGQGSADGPRWWRGLVFSQRSTDGPVLAREHVRRRSELAGVEPRHPLQDVDLVELMLRADPRIAFDPLLNRPLLRGAVEGLIPEEVRLRPRKSTFDAVFQRSIHGPERAVEPLLRDAVPRWARTPTWRPWIASCWRPAGRLRAGAGGRCCCGGSPPPSFGCRRKAIRRPPPG